MKLERLVISVLFIASLALFWLHYTNHISISQLLFAEISLALALITLLLPPASDTRSLDARLPISLWILPIAVYVVAETEILLFRHTGLGYVMALTLALILTVLAREKPAKKVAIATAIVGASLIPLYSLFVPSFGNDTWRDILWAAQAIRVGHVTETAVKHSAYPFPMVPLEYALMSMVSVLDPVWSSVVMGLLYLLQLPLVVFLLSRRFLGLDDYRGAFILLLVPLAVMWSAVYIPQVYSLTLFLTAFLAGSLLLQILLLMAGVFGHGGVAAWMVLTTLGLWISKKEKKIATMLFYLPIIFAAYATYTSLLYALSGAYNSVVGILLAFLRGGKNLVATVPVSAPPTSSLGNLALSILAVSGILVFLYGKGFARTLAFISGTFLVIAYVGASVFPAADLPRYLGLPSATMLAVYAPYGFEIIKRKKVGRFFPLVLIVIAVIAFVYSGVFTPRNPYTGNPYTFSLSGLVNNEEASNIFQVSHFLYNGVLVGDWCSLHLLRYYYGGMEPQTLTLFWAGNYGLYVDSRFLKTFRGYLLFRPTSLDMPGVFSSEVYDVIRGGETSIIFNGKLILAMVSGYGS